MENIFNNSAETIYTLSTNLSNKGVKNWIDFGTLLGAHREKGIIPYDYDMDLCVLIKDAQTIADVKEVIENYHQHGKFLLREMASTNPEIIYQLEFYDKANPGQLCCFRMDIYLVYESNNILSLRCFPDYTCKKFFVDELETIELNGFMLPCPRHVPKLLRLRYGEDFMVPQTHCFALNLPWSHVTGNVIRETKKDVAYTSGVYDVIHVGHIRLFQRMKECFEEVVVGVHDDDSITHKPKPLIPYHQRLEMVQACKYVDRVVEHAPLVTTNELLDSVGAEYVVAGRESDEYIQSMYPVDFSRLHLINRTSDVSSRQIKTQISKA